MSRPKDTYSAVKFTVDQRKKVRDVIVGEAPLQIDINGKPYTVTMRTPGRDLQLVFGLLYTENIYHDRRHLKVKNQKNEEIVSVWIEPKNLKDGYYQSRSLLSVSSCGICGKRELADLEVTGHRLEKHVTYDASQVTTMFENMSNKQTAFQETGGAHAAAIFDSNSEMLAIEEDIGRHNAVDKVIGQAIIKDQVEQARILLVSGRISYEIVAKCFKAGIPVLAAVSSPSTMAIDQADERGITLLAFCRGKGFTCYTHPQRIKLESKKTVQQL